MSTQPRLFLNHILDLFKVHRLDTVFRHSGPAYRRVMANGVAYQIPVPVDYRNAEQMDITDQEGKIQ